jgi:hypothetical protein
MVVGEGYGVPDDDGVRADLDLFDHQPEHALAIGNPEGLRRLVQAAVG